MKYLKFEFADRKDMINKLADYFDKEGNPINCAVVENIQVVKEPAVLNEKGEVEKEAVLSDKYAVDVLFYGKYPELAEEVTPEPSKSAHYFALEEDLYSERYNEKV